MNNKIKILAFAGSTRQDSFNKKLLPIAAQSAQAAGADVTMVDLSDYPLPLYDGDLEARAGIPNHGRTLQRLFLEHHGLLLACPEYNSSISAVLKNTIDWVSRPVPDQPPLACFKGKIVSLMSASPGALGGLRGLVHVRAILGNIGCLVLPEQTAIGNAHKAFDDQGRLLDSEQHKHIASCGQQLAHMLNKLLETP